jgi:hypothetical protein
MTDKNPPGDDMDETRSEVTNKEKESIQDLRQSGIEDQELATEMVKRAEDSSVTIAALTELERSGWGEPDYLKDKPVIDYLGIDEQPQVIVTSGAPPEFHGSYSVNWTKTKGYLTIFVATDKRLLILQGHKNGDMSVSIPYNEIASAEVLETHGLCGVEISTTKGDIELSPTMGALDDIDVRPLIQYINKNAAGQIDTSGEYSTQKSQSSQICPECGWQNPVNNNYCHDCGTDLNQDE